MNPAYLLLLALTGCMDPTMDPGPSPIGPIATTGGDTSAETAADTGATADPPTATLRAPSDDRVEEVDAQTGLPPTR